MCSLDGFNVYDEAELEEYLHTSCRWCRQFCEYDKDFCTNFCAERHAYFQDCGDEEPEEVTRPTCECEGCGNEFFGRVTERYCRNECAYLYAGMSKDDETGEEIMREEEKIPSNFAVGMIYKEKVYDDVHHFKSYVTVLPNGTLQELGSKKRQAFPSWDSWRVYCRTNIMI
jgi:hypothetical protein